MKNLVIIGAAIVGIVVGVGSWKGQVQNPLPSDAAREQIPAGANQPPMLQ